MTLFSPHSLHWTETKLLRGFGIIIVLFGITILTVLWLYFELSHAYTLLHCLFVTCLASIFEGNFFCCLCSSFKFRELLSSISSLVLRVSTRTLSTCSVFALLIYRGCLDRVGLAFRTEFILLFLHLHCINFYSRVI